MQIEKDKVVSIEYTLKDNDGKTLDSSDGAEPLSYLHGRGQLLAKLEDRLQGGQVGDHFDLEIHAQDGYGIIDDNLIQKVDRAQFDGIEGLKPGLHLQADTPQGPMPLMVKEVTDEHVVVDGNHPLAGVDLNFAVKVVGCRDATKEELDHGHAHSGDGHHH